MKRGISKSRGFTLVELLVVMSIIGLLLTILVPTITKATEAVRFTMTKRIFSDLAMSLETYKTDFGGYPPSRSNDASVIVQTPPGTAVMGTGAANLVYYLRGPGGAGWGLAAGGLLPETTSKGLTRTFGPYYQTSMEYMRYGTPTWAAGASVPMGFLDAFSPPGIILYWRYEPNPGKNASSVYRPNYDFLENGDCADGKANYANKTNTATVPVTYFDEIVRTVAPSTSAMATYRRSDYLLVSPGPDGRYGYAKLNETSGNVEPVSSSESGGSCDDFVNW